MRLAAWLLLAAAPVAAQPRSPSPAARPSLEVTAGKSLVLDAPVRIARVAVADPALAETVAVSPRELLINGKAAGETSLVVWEQGGARTVYDLIVRADEGRLDAVRRRLAEELPGQEIALAAESGALFLTGTAADASSAARAASVAGVLGKFVNLLRVVVPPADAQILLKVRFANVDRSAARELGANLVSTGALNTVGATSTGAFAPPQVQPDQDAFSLSDALNIFLFRRDLNLAATIRALESNRLLDILAEPNVLAVDGKPASFVSGGEFPFPTLQGGGAGLGAVTIAFREFGVRIHFLPRVTPRGTIRLRVTPEVSSLDFANGLTFQGFHIPALATRRVETEVELASGQSFVIAGLIDKRLSESAAKIPGLGDIPLLGALFRSQSRSSNSSELMVMVTPEFARTAPAAEPEGEAPTPKTIPVEQLEHGRETAAGPRPAAAAPAPVEFVPVPVEPR